MEKCKYSIGAVLAEGDSMAGTSLSAATASVSQNLRKVSGFAEKKTIQCSFSIESILGLEQKKDGIPAGKPHRPWVDACTNLGKSAACSVTSQAFTPLKILIFSCFY